MTIQMPKYSDPRPAKLNSLRFGYAVLGGAAHDVHAASVGDAGIDVLPGIPGTTVLVF